ncbi:MAG: toll/interleukin-1 receptor domain-containing protein [Candidatus Binatus sp.]
MAENKVNFFISYTAVDERWAEWVAFVLEEDGYSTRLQKWDFAARGNFVLEMQRAASESTHTIGILSPDYLNSRFVKPEWAAALAADPEGAKRSLAGCGKRVFDS